MVTAYVVMAYIVMAYMFMAYMVMAYIVIALQQAHKSRRSNSALPHAKHARTHHIAPHCTMRV